MLALYGNLDYAMDFIVYHLTPSMVNAIDAVA